MFDSRFRFEIQELTVINGIEKDEASVGSKEQGRQETKATSGSHNLPSRQRRIPVIS